MSTLICSCHGYVTRLKHLLFAFTLKKKLALNVKNINNTIISYITCCLLRAASSVKYWKKDPEKGLCWRKRKKESYTHSSFWPTRRLIFFSFVERPDQKEIFHIVNSYKVHFVMLVRNYFSGFNVFIFLMLWVPKTFLKKPDRK